jgi:quercetin dioxygenase-like cupin family protein
MVKEGVMKNRSMWTGFTVLVSCFLMWGTGLCETVVIENSKGKVPVITKKENIAMVSIPSVGDKPESLCEGWTYGTYQTTTEKAVKVNQIVIEPNGKIGTHKGPNSYVCVVTEGEGVLTVMHSSNKHSSTFKYKPGDVIVFKPNIVHRIDNGNQRTVMIGIETMK